MTVITSRVKLEVGKSYGPKELNGLPFANGPHGLKEKYRFMVLKVETSESYDEFIKKEWPSFNPCDFSHWDYYYLISLD